MNLTVPVEGANVRQGINYVKTADGRIVADNPAQGGVPPPPDTGGEGIPVTPPRYQKPPPKENLTPIEQLHPSLDPTKYRLEWDEKTGRARRVEIPQEQAPVETGAEVEGG